MLNRAIDVVLVPPKRIIDRIIEQNKKLLRQMPEEIVLYPTSCVPHISLAMGVVRESDVPRAKDILEKIASECEPLEIIAIHAYAGTTPDGKTLSSVAVEKTEMLQQLHERVMNAYRNIFLPDVRKEDIFSPPVVNELTVQWIHNYSQTSAFQNFNPHITIGFGEGVSSERYSGTAKKIAIFHLGNYCTCRKSIHEINL